MEQVYNVLIVGDSVDEQIYYENLTKLGNFRAINNQLTLGLTKFNIHFNDKGVKYHAIVGLYTEAIDYLNAVGNSWANVPTILSGTSKDNNVSKIYPYYCMDNINAHFIYFATSLSKHEENTTFEIRGDYVYATTVRIYKRV
jgi:hypothetical protein